MGQQTSSMKASDGWGDSVLFKLSFGMSQPFRQFGIGRNSERQRLGKNKQRGLEDGGGVKRERERERNKGRVRKRVGKTKKNVGRRVAEREGGGKGEREGERGGREGGGRGGGGEREEKIK